MNEQDKIRFQEIQKLLYELAVVKSKKYGSAWKDSPLCANGMGVRATFVEINAKVQRLKALAWDEDPKLNRAILYETFGDISNYCILSMLLLELDITEEEWKEISLLSELGKLTGHVDEEIDNEKKK